VAAEKHSGAVAASKQGKYEVGVQFHYYKTDSPAQHQALRVHAYRRMKSVSLGGSEPAVNDVPREIVKSEAVEAVTLASADDAPDYAQARKFDLMFVDSSSPVSDEPHAP
jgi:hypothetical protein